MSDQLASHGVPERAIQVLHFWFIELKPENWFVSSEAIDAIISERFGNLLVAAKADELDHWSETRRGLLALVIVLDQFTRNIHRGTGEAFAFDEKAQALVRKAIDNGMDERLGMDERQFLYMPLMHAEDRSLQALGIEKFEALAETASRVVDFAHRHRDIIERFGRFPYRNPMLGRDSTPEEQEFIDSEGNPFS